ncbi:MULTISPECIES: hypothetical protein [Streptacidiphilus]|uniref:Flp pilus-assembly TadG-like N-terminal domain-containing protein n=1 Tax=Streptacidiphilus cavernicola TaxID=3342716 RepID=A0ABV6UQD2_9ACTN|nr:hypothetical protein [Streptacidiphilus jeojiense]
MAGLAMQPDAHGRLPRPRFRWRYGLGLLLLLCSLLALVAVGQFAGWIGSGRGRAQAEAAADYRASTLLLALRGIPAAGSPGAVPVGEAAYAGAVRRVGGQLLDARYGPAPGQVALTVRITGTSVRGALSGHRTTTVRHCYAYSWTGAPAAAVRSSTDCPPVAADLYLSAGKAEVLAGRLALLSGTAAARQADLPGLLSAAKAPPNTAFQRTEVSASPKSSTVVTAISDPEDGCVFVELSSGVLTAWPAPLLAACTPARATQAVQVG